MIKVSIITATYNSEMFIACCINSVQQQTYSAIEHIVVDGGSTDKTLSILNEFKHIKLITGKDNGIYDALNKGIDAATGNVIAILHSDDFYTNNLVIENYAALFEKSGCDAIYSNLHYVDRKNTLKIVRNWHSGIFSKNKFKYGWMPPHPTVFIKKKVYEDFGKFNLEFTSAADYELMLRLFYKNTVLPFYLNEFTVKMRVGGQSNKSLKNRIIANKEDKKAWLINNLRPFWFTLYLKPLRKIGQFIFKH
ncbi:MAG: glycosyltransferase [Bacteroidetes bacterium]|nr:glycosyltransferase [Bacteroidota bacterium]